MSKAILCKPNKPLRVIDFKDELDFYYKQLNCQCIDIVYVKDFLLIVDDEGLLVDNPQINIIASVLYGHPICGNVLIVKNGIDENGENICVGLDSNDIYEFQKQIFKLIDKRSE